MPNAVIATLADVLSSCRLHFTTPAFFRFLVLALGWILAGEPRRCVTEALVATRVSGQMHWAAFHRFFSRATWCVDALGRTVLGLLAPLCNAGWIEVALDDTLAPKKGRCVFGASMHVEPVRSTRQRRNLVLGHCWVVLSIVVNVPWSQRPWAIPVLFRLYRGKKEAGGSYRKKTVLAREMLDLVLAWLPETTRIRLLLDSGYMNRPMLRGLPLARVTVFGALKTNAALYRAPKAASTKRRGRRCKKGERMATPAKMHRDRRWGWTNVTTTIYQKSRQQRVLSLQAQWYGVLGDLLTRVVVVDVDANKVRVFLSTDVEQTAESVLEQFARRWSVEVWHRDSKQDFGFADSPAWSEQAVRRTAPWAGLLSSLVVVWFHRIHGHVDVPLPERPWYTWKKDLSYADLVRTAREALRSVEFVGWARAVIDRRDSVFAGALKPKATALSPSPNIDQTPLAA